jgi:septum formation protein
MLHPNLRQHMARILKSCKVVLASGSPRRKDLLAEMNIDTEILVPDVDEKSVLDNNPKRLVIKEALLKNRGARSQFDCDGKVVISADTIVYRRKEYTKPRDLANAVEILTELCGKWHSVYTGVVVHKDGKEISFAVRSLVRLKNLTKDEIQHYVNTFKPLDKAGAYAIQENTVVDRWIGSYTNIVGLPTEKLEKVLKKLGVHNG